MNKNMYTKNIEEIGYYGEVYVQLKNGDTVISERRFHNKGHNTLFKFLCNCIAGNYIDADKLRPIQLKAYTTGASLAETLKLSDKDLCESNRAKTTFITTDQPPYVQPVYELNNIVGYSVTLHFMIPYLYLINYAEVADSDNINYLLLFANIPATQLNSPQDYLTASYFFVDEKDSDKWNPLDLKNANKNTNIIIEWTLTITNI